MPVGSFKSDSPSADSELRSWGRDDRLGCARPTGSSSCVRIVGLPTPHFVRIFTRQKLKAESPQLGVFRFGLLEDGYVGAGVFPKGEKILVGALCLGRISRQHERPS